MPIYEQTYRRYEARAPLRQARFWPITREALRLILARRAFLGLLIVAWVPFVFRVIQIYIVTRFPEAGRILPVDGRLFGEFLNQQLILMLFLTIFGGAGLIANDLRTGAILVYLSRPLTRRDYVVGKLSVLLALNFSATLAPGLLLYAIALALAPEQFLKWSLTWIGPAIVLHCVVLSGVMSLLALAVSALSRSARVAGLGLFGLILGLEMVSLVLRLSFTTPYAILVSILANLQYVGTKLFAITGPDAPAIAQASVHWSLAAVLLVGICLACLAILRSRVRAVEIVT